jgi:hypothetical protein
VIRMTVPFGKLGLLAAIPHPARYRRYLAPVESAHPTGRPCSPS